MVPCHQVCISSQGTVSHFTCCITGIALITPDSIFFLFFNFFLQFFLLRSNRHTTNYSQSTNKWHHCPLSFLHQKPGYHSWLLFPLTLYLQQIIKSHLLHTSQINPLPSSSTGTTLGSSLSQFSPVLQKTCISQVYDRIRMVLIKFKPNLRFSTQVVLH